MAWRFIGAVLLIIGTSIGAGILALPAATALAGIDYSIGVLVISWFIMTLGALFLLEANCKMPLGSNLVTMAKQTLGPWGQLIVWLIYLLLLYSLLSAYLAGGTDVVHDLSDLIGTRIPHWLATVIFLIALGYVVLRGIKAVDSVNKLLMIVKVGSFVLLTLLLLPHIQLERYHHGSWPNAMSAFMVTITSFGFAIIIPSLRVYLKNNTKLLRNTVITGSLIALFGYILWLTVAQGDLPLLGPWGLKHIHQANHTVSSLTQALLHITHTPFIALLIHLFTSVCMLTAFLGVALSLFDFLRDGLQLKEKPAHTTLNAVLTFLPPLILTLFFTSVFIAALQYAGTFCLLLLALLPNAMAWRLRKQQGPFEVPGGYPILIGHAILSVIVVIIGFIS